MDANPETLKKLIENELFRVPKYQRLYSWKDEQFEEFYNTLMQYENYSESNSYFFGSMILKKDTTTGKNISDVIDGQQRLTTILIVLKVISDIFETSDYKNKDFYIGKVKTILKKESNPDEFSYRIEHNKEDKNNFEKLIDSSFAQIKAEEEKSISNIYKAYYYFYKALTEKEEKVSFEELGKILTFLTEDCKMIVIRLSGSDDEQTIFNTMNSVGLKLFTADLLKNWFFQDKNLIEKYFNKWEELFETTIEKIEFWDKEVGSRRKISHLDMVLFSVLLIESTNNKNNSFKQKITYNHLFKNYKELAKDNKEEILNNIFKSANDYFNSYINYKNLENLGYADKRNILIFIMETVGLRVPYTFLIYMDRQDSKFSDNEKTQLYCLLNSLLISINLLSMPSNFFNKWMYDLLHTFQTKGFDEGVRKLKGKIEEFLSDFQTKYRENSRKTLQKKYQKALLPLVLLEIYERSKNGSDQRFDFKNNLNIEHIAPQKPQGHYGGIKEGDEIINSIGNLTLLGSKLNTTASNKPYGEKKKFYENSGVFMNKELVNKNSFLKEDIEHRETLFIKNLEKIINEGLK